LDLKNGLSDGLFNSKMRMVIAQVAVKKNGGRRDMPWIKNGLKDGLFNSKMRLIKTQDTVKKMDGRREMAYGQIHSY
jgi:hypothetical protein